MACMNVRKIEALPAMSVAVIIPTFNHARFLGEAISSVLAQTRPADEIIVVNDGSIDDPAAVVAGFPGVRLIRQENRGLSAARNRGLQSCTTSHVVFLDADDRLLPIALETGLNHAARYPDCAFVYGGYYEVSEDRSSRGPDCRTTTVNCDYLELLRGNNIGLPATVLYRRECLMEVGGFDETLRGCQDYDLYLRIAQRYPISSHETIVAEYRKHDHNMSNNNSMMLREALFVLDRHERRTVPSTAELAALQKGRARSREYWASKMLETARARWGSFEAIVFLLQAAKVSPKMVVGRILSKCKDTLRPWSG
jgi:glycosyltransferase involved in cell wall biosynthesis